MLRASRIALGLALLLALAACVAGSVDSGHSAASGGIMQFLLGLWHGIIAPVTLLGEIVNWLAPHLLPWKVKLYETRGTGLAYDIGFYLGLVGSGPIVIRTWPRRRRL